VSLTATNSAGFDTNTKLDYITVMEPSGTVMHVDDMVVTRISQGPNFRGSVDVTVVDQTGQAVAKATVTGFFNAPNSNSKSAVTGADGVANVRSDKTKSPPVNWCFEVTDIALTGATYNPAANVWTVRCEDGSGSAGSPAVTLGWGGEEGGGIVFSGSHPNPLTATTTITFRVPRSDRVRLDIFDVAGRRMVTLADEEFGIGQYNLIWDASDEPGGIYFYRLAVGKQVQTRKMILVR
jgi:PKD repeat protein